MNVITNNTTKCASVLDVLADVRDPEVNLNVVDLGLIYQVDFDEDNLLIFISMTLTTRFCPMGHSIVNSVQHAIQQTFKDYKIQINLIFIPKWKSEMISLEGNKQLNT